VHIKALVTTSLIDYPEHIADVVYVGACNFRCPYCHNFDLVLHPERLPDIVPAKVLHDLELRRGFVDGVVITGGEPTLQPDLLEFLADIRNLGLAIKLDTNGYRPDVLQKCLEQQLVDYVAMDIKSSFAKYEMAAGVSLDVGRLQRSIELILNSEVEYEFRTTIVPGLVDVSDVQAIVRAIHGATRYYLQCFRPGPTVGWSDGETPGPPSPKLLEKMLAIAAREVQEVQIRGLPSPVKQVSQEVSGS